MQDLLKKMNTRLPFIVRWVDVDMDIEIKWLNWPHTGFKVLRAGRTSNVQNRMVIEEKDDETKV